MCFDMFLLHEKFSQALKIHASSIFYGLNFDQYYFRLHKHMSKNEITLNIIQ
jgi:hypothetical protein